MSEEAGSLRNAPHTGLAPVPRRVIRIWTIGLLLLCVGALWLQFRHIESTLPYPWDTDEGFVSGPASRTLVTGTLHPYTFNYPSLPKYLASIGMAVGFIRSATHLEIRDIHDLGNVGYPYYQTPRAVQGARQLFALLSVIALAATGIAAWHAFRRPSAILIAPLILSASQLFFYHSWTYLNVDIVGLCFSALTLAACLQGTRQPSMRQLAVIPGVFAGLATGSKYTLALMILPVLLASGMYLKPGRRMWGCLAAIASMVAAFVVVVPYSLIDIPSFLSGVGFEAFHYARGHVGWDGAPGLPQLIFYGKHFRSEFGVIGIAVAVLGAAAYCLADWRRAAVLFAFPLALFWMLASQRVHFERNVLSVHPILAMSLANGMIVVHGWMLKLAARRELTARRMRQVAILASLILLVAAVPIWHFRDQLRDRTDSRKLAQAWIEKRIPIDWAIVVPSQMRFDPRGLKAHGSRVVEVDMQSAQDADAFQRLLGTVPGSAIIMVPRWGADARFPGQETAEALNRVSSHLQVVKTFGTNPVLVNYSEPAPWGNPAFSIAVLGRQQIAPE